MTKDRRTLTSVALTYSRKDFAAEGCGTSGFHISEDCILSHGSLLKAAVARNPRIREFFENMKSGELKIVPKDISPDLKLRIYRQKSMTTKMDSSGNSAKILNPELLENSGTVIATWKCPLLENTLRELFFSWNFAKNGQRDRSLLSIFLIVTMRKNFEKISSKDQRESTREILRNFIVNCPIGSPLRGQNVETTSTPFGNPVFIDSVSRGVVSNIFGDDDCVMLTDANAVPGSEGAPVYVIRRDGTRSYICGIVIAPLSWCRGEWVDYTFAANLIPCLRRLLSPTIVNRHVIEDSESIIADSLDRSLVLVSCGDGWGTGIIFDAGSGTIITCSHVVQKAPESRIKVVLRRIDASRSSGSSSPSSSSTSTSSWAKLVYRTAKGEPYDVAVLSLDPREIEHTLRSIKFADDRPVILGEAVGSAGFPFFSSGHPTITRGNVSGTNNCMLRTTCCVQSGSSGGPIIRWSTGEMLGMVVCNSISTDTEKLYPRLNMAVPLSILKPPIDEYLRTGLEIRNCEMASTTDYSAKLLRNVHTGLPSPEPGKTALINGDYEYWHYLCDGFNDQGWGCGYRTLQTISSWLKLNKEMASVPSLPEIQKILVDIEDKEPSFIGSKSWIGSFEVCLVLDQRYEIRSKIIHVSLGKNLADHVENLRNHFQTFGSPIMMGGDKDCSSKGIVGIHEGNENTYLLVVDPHFIGRAKCPEQLQKDNWIKWQNLNDFVDSSFYNLCLPQIKCS